MVDLKRYGSPTSPTQGQAYLIIYGLKPSHSDVPVDVYDSPFIFEKNKMVMENDLDMNSHSIKNVKTSNNNDVINLSYLKTVQQKSFIII